MVSQRKVIGDRATILRQYESIRDRPRGYIRRLWVQGVGERGKPKKMQLEHLWDEQIEWLIALICHRLVLGIKPRQVGFTTITTAYFLWKCLTSGEARAVLQMVHEKGTLRRIRQMLRFFVKNLPPELRPRCKPDSLEETVFAHTEGGFNRLLAGGSGQGRGWTYTDVHGTEMSKWRSGTAHQKTDDGVAADEETWTSALATVHDEGGQIVVESTGNGARGMFYDLYETAKVDPAWKLVFTPWNRVPRYRLALSDDEKRRLEDDLDSKEKKLADQFGLDLEQIAWRRWKLRTLKGSELTFRREYPLTDAEPFLLQEAGWFDIETLQAQLRFASQLSATEERLIVWEPWQEGHRYALSLDTSGGTGLDEASLHVIRDDLTQVCTWNHDRAPPLEQAQMASRIGGLYRRPIAAIERNKYGHKVIEHLKRLGGCRILNGDDGEAGIWMDPNTKREIMVNAREVIDADRTTIRDAETIRQGLRIVEKPNGKIEGTGTSRDDRIVSYALGLWGARAFWRPEARGELERERRRIRNVLEIATKLGG